MNIRKRLKLGTAMLLVCSVAGLGMVGTALSVEPAYAKKGENNGNGGNSASAKSSNAAGGNSAAQAERKAARDAAKAEKAAARAATKAARAESRAVAKAEKVNHGSLASKLGALNAAHANPNAFLHASPNSRVGRIAAYRDAAVEAGVAEAELQALLEEQGFETVDEMLAFYGVDSLEDFVADVDENGTPDILDAIDGKIAAVGDPGYDPSADPDFPADYVTEEEVVLDDGGTPDDPSDDVTEIQTTYDVASYLSDLGAERDSLAAGAEVAGAAAEADALSGDAFALLEAAGNKPVDEEVQGAVNDLLGLAALVEAAIAEAEAEAELAAAGEGEELPPESE